MPKNTSQYFQNSGSDINNVSGAQNITTDSIDLTNFNSAWILEALSTHTSGSPSITIKFSKDDVDFYDYKQGSVGVAVTNTILDGEFLPRFMQVVYTAAGSDGNLTLSLSKITP